MADRVVIRCLVFATVLTQIIRGEKNEIAESGNQPMIRAYSRCWGTHGGADCLMTGGARAGGYSKASLKGIYIFRGSGVGLFAAPNQPSVVPGFAAGFGTVTFDGAGHFTGTQTVSSTPMQGVPTPGPRPATGEKANPVQITCPYRLTGTYEVSADGGYTSSFSTTPATKENCVGANFTASGVLGSGGKVFMGSPPE
jgi:hypothetical protein